METLDYKGYTIRIEQDEDAQNPRTEHDNVGTMVCFHHKYRLGDKHSYDKADFDSWDELKERLIADGAHIILPLYLYDHSGITMNTTGFTCRWDSGQVGFIFCLKEQVQAEWDGDDEKAKAYLESEVKTYDDHLTGNVYGYKITSPEGKDLDDSCWGYFGDPEKSGVIDEAKSIVDAYIEDKNLPHVETDYSIGGTKPCKRRYTNSTRTSRFSATRSSTSR